MTASFTGRNEAIARSYRSGLLSMQEIADAYGITRERVRQIVNYVDGRPASRRRLHGRMSRRRMAFDLQRAEIIERLRAGESGKSVIASTGWPRNWVYAALHEARATLATNGKEER